MKRQDNGNEQLNSIRNEFNNRVEAKSYLGRAKRVAWTVNRRFRSIWIYFSRNKSLKITNVFLNSCPFQK